MDLQPSFHDVGRRPIGVIGPDPDGVRLRLNLAGRTSYDARGLPFRVETGNTAGHTDPAWAGFTPAFRTETAYDAARRPVVSRLMTGGSSTAEVTQVAYDAAGRVECVTQRMNPATWSSLPGSACTAATAGSFGPDRIVRTAYDAAELTS